MSAQSKTKSTSATGKRGGSVSAQGTAKVGPKGGTASGSASGTTARGGSGQASGTVSGKNGTYTGSAQGSGTTAKGKSYGGTVSGTATQGQGGSVTVAPQNGTSRTKTVPAKQ